MASFIGVLGEGTVAEEAKAYTKVFISYSWDSDEHKERVLQLANTLRVKMGVDADIDRYVRATPPYTPAQGWDLWMQDRIEWAEFVLMVCTETYKRRFEGKEEPKTGLGVTWEGTIIRQNLYNDQLRDTKFIPIVFSSSNLEHVPIVLNSRDKYILDDNRSYTELCYRLRKQSTIIRPKIGAVELQLPPEPKFFTPQPSQKPSIETAPVFSNVTQAEDSIIPTEDISIQEVAQENAIDEYRRRFEEYASDGEISTIESLILQDLQEELGLTDPEVGKVQDEVLAPYKKYQKNLDRYREHVTKLITEQGYPLDEKTLAELEKMKDHWTLKPGDANSLKEEIGLRSLKREGGIDYTKLYELLVNNEWKEADRQTWILLCQVAGKQKEGRLDREDIKNFPCEELQVIDRLWLKLSGGRLGFSVQKNIYQKLDGEETELERIKKLARQVNWFKLSRDWWSNDFKIEERRPIGGYLEKKNVSADRIAIGFLPICLWLNLGTRDFQKWRNEVSEVEDEADTRKFFGNDPDEPPFEMSAAYERIKEAKDWLKKEVPRIEEKEKKGEREWEGITFFERLEDCNI